MLNFCQDDFDHADELSDSEPHKEDKVALNAAYKSSFQAAVRKKIMAISQQGEGWEDDAMINVENENISFFVANGNPSVTQQIANSLIEYKRANIGKVKEFSVQAK